VNPGRPTGVRLLAAAREEFSTMKLLDTGFAGIVLLTAGFVLIAGCTKSIDEMNMQKTDMTSFDRDHYQCYMESEAGWGRPVVNVGSLIDNRNAKRKMYNLCMKARGYREGD
jgi:hypothetical protein